jgi:hypothetical protein
LLIPSIENPIYYVVGFDTTVNGGARRYKLSENPLMATLDPC